MGVGALTFFRAARRAVGLAPQPEYPNLEALLEAEADQPSNEYRLAARIAPPIIGGLGATVFTVLSFVASPFFAFGAVGMIGLATGLWFMFDRQDKKIGPEKARLRKRAHDLWERYGGFASVVGVKPAFSENVCEVLDEAASIYLKHSAQAPDPDSVYAGTHAKAAKALEDAMGRMLELGLPQTVAAQELELDAGWARALLQEMRDLDRALDNHRQIAANGASHNDPRARLLEARIELQQIDSAIDELDQRA